MKKYDNIVVGSGISGLTLALILGLNGRKVLLIEKAPQIGGSLARFWRKGLPFDTGFHFTGAFSEGGLLCDMLKVLGIEEEIEPVFLKEEGSMRFVYKKEGEVYDLPYGLDNLIAKLKEYFPSEEKGITKYFEMMERICNNTVTMDLRKISLAPEPIDEDFVSVDEVLDGLIKNQSLRGLLSAYCMCYGTMPAEASFANHSRVSLGLYQSVAYSGTCPHSFR
ncbi:MAG: NAD(P)-binding protein [Candidatus Aadella gelida]|nr:NAD(P)-binding protein [Candidatus Aadella gelida]